MSLSGVCEWLRESGEVRMNKIMKYNANWCLNKERWEMGRSKLTFLERNTGRS